MFGFNSGEGASRFSFVKGLTYPLMTINDNIINFLVLTCFFSFVSFFICFLIGRSFMCGIILSAEIDLGVFCSNNNFLVFVSIIVNLLLMGFYLNRLPLITEKHEKKQWFLQKLGWKKELKALTLVCLYLLFWGMACGFGAILKYRQPTPDWRIELSFFVVCSLVIILALLALLFFSGFLNYLHGGHLREMKKIFWPIFDEIFKPIFGFLIYMLIFIFLFANTFKYFVASLNVYSVIVSEFCFYFLVYLMAAVIYFSYEYQEKELFI